LRRSHTRHAYSGRSTTQFSGDPAGRPYEDHDMSQETPAPMQPYPPEELWPKFIYSLPELAYSEQVNACYGLLDTHLTNGRGAVPAIYFWQFDAHLWRCLRTGDSHGRCATPKRDRSGRPRIA